MKNLPDLRPLLLAVQRAPLAREETTRLVLVCRGIAIGLLHGYHHRAAGILASHGWSVHDLSLDCVAELFAVDSAGRFRKIEEFLSRLPGPVNDLPESEVFLALRGYVNRFVLYRLRKLLGEADPEGRRIARNIRESLKRGKGPLRLSKDIAGDLLELRSDASDNALPEMTQETLEREIFPLVNQARSIPEILDLLAKALERQRSHRKSARLIDVVQVIKRFYAERFFDDAQETDSVRAHAFDALPEGNTEELKEAALRFVARKIDSIYYRTRKIELEDAKGLLLTMSAILDEWFTGEIPKDGWYVHIRKTIGCTKEEYDRQWSVRVHYLVKLMRSFLRDQLDVTRDTMHE